MLGYVDNQNGTFYRPVEDVRRCKYLEDKSCMRKEMFRFLSQVHPLRYILGVFLNYNLKYLYYCTALVFFGNSSCMLDFSFLAFASVTGGFYLFGCFSHF